MTTTLDHPAPNHEPQHRAAPEPTPAPRRRLRYLLAAAVVLVLAAASLAVVRFVTDDARRDYLAADGWPVHGQAAYAIGDGAARLSRGQRPAPIASMAKVMTAYVVLRAAPLHDGAQGPSITVTAADVADTEQRRRQDQSVVRLAAGERLTERQALLAVLLPSANNVAVLATRFVDRSVGAFVRRMNATARALGMRHTTYTDPSGYDDATVSTAADQLRLARVAGSDPTLQTMTATAQATIPVQGTIRTTDLLLGRGGVIGMKTGSDDAAGGCFMLHARRLVDGVRTDVWAVVMGQPGRHLLLTGQYAARQLLERVAR